MRAPSTRVDLCRLDEIEEPGTRGFELPVEDGPPLRLFVVRKAGLLTAYSNSCPHTGAPLEWQPHQFLDRDNAFIQCAIHGALFRAEDGYCLRGPCVGASLHALGVWVVDGRVVVDLGSAATG